MFCPVIFRYGCGKGSPGLGRRRASWQRTTCKQEKSTLTGHRCSRESMTEQAAYSSRELQEQDATGVAVERQVTWPGSVHRGRASQD